MLVRAAVVLVLTLTMIGPPSSHGQGEGPLIDPLTGQPMVTEEDAAPAGPDLSEANALIREGKYDDAATLLRGLKEEFPESAAVHLLLGEVLLALGQPALALPELQRAAEAGPDLERVQFQIGSACAALGKDDEALEAFGLELERTEDVEIEVLSRLNRSLLYEKKRMWGEAAAELDSALADQPDRVDLYGDLAALLIQAGKLEDAETALARGSEAGFRSAAHWYSLGARYYNQRAYEGAVRAFAEALEIDASLARAERSLAASLEKLGRSEESAEHLRRYLELRPDDPERDKILRQIEAATGSD
jgi:tetratricopeptide (TPR) repeat protein